MKSLLATAGALALILSAAACDNTDVSSKDTPTETATTATTPVEPAPTGPVRTVYTLAVGEIEASDLLGASVQSVANEEISIVEDIWLADGNSKAMLILRDGGVAGVGGTLRSIAFDSAAIVPDDTKPGDEPDVIVRLTEATLDLLPEFKQSTADDDRLASELTGKTVMIGATGQSARINDLILSSTGQTRYAVISPDLISMEQILVDADTLVVAEGDADGQMTLDVTAQILADAPAYKRE